MRIGRALERRLNDFDELARGARARCCSTRCRPDEMRAGRSADGRRAICSASRGRRLPQVTDARGRYGAARVHRLRRGRDLPPDPERFALLYRLLLAAVQDERDLLRSRVRPAMSARLDGWPGGAARRPQDEGLRALPAIADETARALRRLVRAGALHRCERDGAVLRAPLHRHELGDPDALPLGALGRRSADSARARRKADVPADGCARAGLADLLRVDLQSGAAQGEDDADGDAEEILAQPAGGRTHSLADPRRRSRRRRR